MAATLNANALVDLDPTKIYLNIPLAETSQDDLIRDFINEASSLIESYCNRKFREQTITELRNGGRTYEIVLNQWPVSSITSVHEDSSRVFGVNTLLDSTEYMIGENERAEGFTVEKFNSVFAQGRKIIQIIYTFGYALYTDVPSDIQLACKRTAAYYFKQQQNQDFIEIEKSKGNEDIVLIDGLPKSASLILDNYRRLEMLGTPDSVRNR